MHYRAHIVSFLNRTFVSKASAFYTGLPVALFTTLILGISGISGCTNNVGTVNLTTSTNSDGTDSLSGVTNSEDSYVKISQVLPNATDPTTTFDIIGDGTGVFGSFCGSSSSSTSSTSSSSSSGSSSACTCQFSYISNSGNAESVEVNPTYSESDLVRCKYDSIASGLSYINIRLHFTSSDTYSSEFQYSFGSTTATLDTSSTDSFSLVTRFQCRDNPVIYHALDGSMYDPFQSEDPSIAFPLNFYSTNMGASIAAFATANTDGKWDCPAIPNDPAAGVDLTLYSVTSDGSSKQIYPATGSNFDRSTFYLAKQSTGAFTVAVQALIAPNVTTQSPGSDGKQASGTYAPLGYGVRPVATSTGEDCPTDVTIPEGFHWAKVWLFRASLAPRYAAGSYVIGTGNQVFCNPGLWKQGDTSTDNPIVDDCDTATKDGGYTASDGLADRVIISALYGTTVCTNVQNVDGLGTAGVGYVTDPTDTSSYRSSTYDVFELGTDYWVPAGGDPTVANGGQNHQPVFNLWSGNYPRIPHDPGPTLVDVDNSTSRFDFVYVVSPTTIMSNDMKNATSASLPYTPYRFTPPSACLSNDPDAPTSATDCLSSKRLNYQIRMTDLSTNADASGDSSSRLPTFPVCAIQPD